jgi:hypothetical protein
MRNYNVTNVVIWHSEIPNSWSNNEITFGQFSNNGRHKSVKPHVVVLNGKVQSNTDCSNLELYYRFPYIWKQSFPVSKSKRNCKYETKPDIRKRIWEGSKERFSFNGDTNGNNGFTFWRTKGSAFNTRNVAATCPMVLQQTKSVSITMLT